MLLYLLLPAFLWLASCRLLQRSRGQKGFDTFFWHFVLLGLEGVAALLLLEYFQVPGANRITLAVIGGHTLVLFGWSVLAYARRRRPAARRSTARLWRSMSRHVQREA